MDWQNVYADPARAAAYAQLAYPGTYYLAFRDLPEILARHVRGRRALDFGCGAGRSSRFLKKLGFEVVGADISAEMIAHARAQDPEGSYVLLAGGDLREIADAAGTRGEAGTPRAAFDLVLAAFTFDNIPTCEEKLHLFTRQRELLGADGRIVSVVSTPEVYTNEWASFTTQDYPENRQARSGDRVRIVMKDVPDSRPVEDVLFTDASCREVYEQAGLALLETHKPLATPSEPFDWVNETRIAPWAIYVLGRT